MDRRSQARSERACEASRTVCEHRTICGKWQRSHAVVLWSGRIEFQEARRVAVAAGLASTNVPTSRHRFVAAGSLCRLANARPAPRLVVHFVEGARWPVRAARQHTWAGVLPHRLLISGLEATTARQLDTSTT